MRQITTPLHYDALQDQCPVIGGFGDMFGARRETDEVGETHASGTNLVLASNLRSHYSSLTRLHFLQQISRPKRAIHFTKMGKGECASEQSI